MNGLNDDTLEIQKNVNGDTLSPPSGLLVEERFSSMGSRPWLSAVATPWLCLIRNQFHTLHPVAMSGFEIGSMNSRPWQIVVVIPRLSLVLKSAP